MNKNYFLAGFAALFMASTVNAQIVYTDITDGIPAGIDFDTDGTLEFEITDGSGTADYITYWNGGADNNIHAIGNMTAGDWDTPDCVADGFTIDASNNWEGQGDASITAWGGTNPTVTEGADEYLAMKFNLGGTEVYYGWVRFELNGTTVTYKDYAYNSTAGEAIDAGAKGGQGGVGLVSESMKTGINLYPNPATEYISIQNENGLNISSVKILNSLGVEVLNLNTNNFETKNIDVSTFTKGLYFVQLFGEGSKIEAKRLIIQ
ncbi:T9SS type A sorting domain-containing protein [Brumimicrobium glaciale]|uniref:T9SS type A sorting domain-containing protein n=1 Tax=Brumimicrobium glaciale TaxID=200475 RepID=A0A4Q4KNS3_9FLAO|nr:T9SS type A sorting domain-containing protein [Brumimicrobium glaciale]RYM35032.1 T9SS type A sorting domain-containing protein [Brumimicrobium glaciale]